jgi:hypothetical protein
LVIDPNLWDPLWDLIRSGPIELLPYANDSDDRRPIFPTQLLAAIRFVPTLLTHTPLAEATPRKLSLILVRAFLTRSVEHSVPCALLVEFFCVDLRDALHLRK